MLSSLPEELENHVIRFLSVVGLLRLRLVCARHRMKVSEQAELLLVELTAAASTLSSVAVGASTICSMARLCGRRPVVPWRFARTLECQLHDFITDGGISIPALDRLFLVFGALQYDPFDFFFSLGPLRFVLDDVLRACATLCGHEGFRHVQSIHVERALVSVWGPKKCTKTLKRMRKYAWVDDEADGARVDGQLRSDEMYEHASHAGFTVATVHQVASVHQWISMAAYSESDVPYGDCDCTLEDWQCHDACRCRLTNTIFDDLNNDMAAPAVRQALEVAHARAPRSKLRLFRLTETEHTTLSLALHELACLSDFEIEARGADVVGLKRTREECPSLRSACAEQRCLELAPAEPECDCDLSEVRS